MLISHSFNKIQNHSQYLQSINKKDITSPKSNSIIPVNKLPGTTGLTRLTLYLCHLTSDICYQTSVFRNLTSDIIPLSSNVCYQTSFIRHLTSNVGSQTPVIRHHTFVMRRLTSDVCYQTPVIRRLTSDVCL